MTISFYLYFARYTSCPGGTEEESTCLAFLFPSPQITPAPFVPLHKRMATATSLEVFIDWFCIIYERFFPLHAAFFPFSLIYLCTNLAQVCGFGKTLWALLEIVCNLKNRKQKCLRDGGVKCYDMT